MKTVFICIAACLFIGTAYGQVLETNNLTAERGYETVMVTGNGFPLFNEVPKTQLFLYIYQNGSGWSPVPFQIDERDVNAKGVYEPDGFFNHQDELLLLAKDLGDRVSLGNWIDNADSRLNNRYEIEIIDSRDNTQKGWCYLHRSTTLGESDKSDVNYLIYEDSTRVNGSYYQLVREKAKWYPKDISVTTRGGGNGQDLYDRTKLRIRAIPFPGIDIALDEDDFAIDTSGSDSIGYVLSGPIRIEHRIKLKLNVPELEYGATFTLKYLPFSTNLHGKVELQSGWHFKLLRMSYDCASVANTIFYSGDANGLKNSNIAVDGNSDKTVVNKNLDVNSPNWTMVTNNAGTILTMNDVFYAKDPSITEPYVQYLFYRDSALVKDTNDTGDSLSYGDHGMIFESDDLVGVATYNSLTYLLPVNQSTGLAQVMFENFNSPMNINLVAQNFLLDVASEEDPRIPNAYRLNPNYPNPFNPVTTITFGLPQSDRVLLEIFDVQGQHIRTIINQRLNAGVHRYQWDGKDSRGNSMSSGIYFYKLRTDHFSAMRKMTFIK